ncbi:hypothetical protein DJ480_10910 [Pseudomonas sp. Leaf98]|nr:hypothetical protein DJ480_10910 [Pseudomonas sp. Leaf98]
MPCRRFASNAIEIVPTLCVVMHPVTLRVTTSERDAERPGRHSHAERGNDQSLTKSSLTVTNFAQSSLIVPPTA